MPPYPWLIDQKIDKEETKDIIEAMQWLGVPYEEGYADNANRDLDEQAAGIVASLKEDGIEALPESEIVALIAYLQRLGTDIKSGNVANAAESNKKEDK